MLGKLLRTLAAVGSRVPVFSQALRHYQAGDAAGAALLCEQALARAPSDPDALALLALCRQALGEATSALESWRRVLDIQPGDAEALCAIGEAARATGLARGKRESEPAFAHRLGIAREMVSFWAQQDRLWRRRPLAEARIPLPVWDGGRLEGKRILIHSFRGFGDAIHFSRYAARLAERGARVRVECDRALHRLLERCPGVSDVAETEAPAAARHCHLQAPLVVLLKHFFFEDLTREQRAYLTADAERSAAWRERLARLPGLRVGLCWAGNPGNKNDARRSMAFPELEPLLGCAGMCWVSLQKGAAAAALQSASGAGINDGPAELSDFFDTAALIANLDLVISVNTAVAHLAGALGKPVWILYSEDEDRRWEVAHDAQAAYPRARLFKRKAADWGTAVADVGRALGAQAPAG